MPGSGACKIVIKKRKSPAWHQLREAVLHGPLRRLEVGCAAVLAKFVLRRGKALIGTSRLKHATAAHMDTWKLGLQVGIHTSGPNKVQALRTKIALDAYLTCSTTLGPTKVKPCTRT